MGDDINITAIEFVNGEDMLMQIDLHNVSTNEYWRTFITCKEFFRMVQEGSQWKDVYMTPATVGVAFSDIWGAMEKCYGKEENEKA